MSEGLFSSVDLSANTRAGFRLDQIEIFNWGTFDKRVWQLSPHGETTLLTGDIGSGKSTLVDAVTTLLLPAHRISYNKAAGADTKERTLRSYVEGHYKSERIEATGASRAIGLRDDRSYSVILGRFVNEGYDETVTLAQVFHQKDRAGQPDRFFVTSDKSLSLEADFTSFGSGLTELRKRLRSSGADIHSTFTDYSRTARRRLGIRSEQAMELFHQTVSMKSVGNLNEFVRSHMLEPVDSSDRVRAIVAHFEDLTKAHDAVKRAQDQLEALGPLVATADKYEAALSRRSDAELQRDAVRVFCAELRLRLLSEEIYAYSAERTNRVPESEALMVGRTKAAQEREQLITARATAGGDRIGELTQRAAAAREEAHRRQERRAAFDARLHDAGLDPVHDPATFAQTSASIARAGDQVASEHERLDERFVLARTRRDDLKTRGDDTRAELMSLAGRSSNLPVSQLDVRSQLCRDLDLDEEALPFAGELIDVKDEHGDWRGAAERVLRGFALSLLVPDQHYAEVSTWVNDRRLMHRRHDGNLAGSRLDYERVPPRRVSLQSSDSGAGLALAACLDVRAGSFESYVRHELVRRADHRCTDTIEEFRAARRAVTRSGQVRSGDRHVKDDRSKIDDPRTWVLGWVNERKVAALTQQLAELQSQLIEIEDDLQQITGERQASARRRTAIDALSSYTSWSELDWQEAQSRAVADDEECERLLAGSSTLAEIERRLADNASHAAKLDEQARSVDSTIARLDVRIEGAEDARGKETTVLAAWPTDDIESARLNYPVLQERLGRSIPERSEDVGPAADRLTSDLQKVIETAGREIGGYVTSLIQDMNKILTAWPELRSEMDADVDSLADFRTFHTRVAEDDLPRFEADFKEQLNTNTIRELAGFNNWLNRQADEIQARIDRINDAMGAIDYSPGRYIRLEKERTVNQDIQGFRHDLRQATDDALSPAGDHYSERRFVDVKRIIERFRGREGHSDADKTWTRRVTDVRNWFTFSASERDRLSEEEWEHYRDSDGKSGGQKEKLAYTILAASLAYQFGLEWGATKSRDFRFAVIDEAFGRGSDASTRYALELFGKLGLQLLIVTPLQKVHVIEPYVRAIGFVDNPSGKYSRLQTLTIEEFHTMRADRT